MAGERGEGEEAFAFSFFSFFSVELSGALICSDSWWSNKSRRPDMGPGVSSCVAGFLCFFPVSAGGGCRGLVMWVGIHIFSCLNPFSFFLKERMMCLWVLLDFLVLFFRGRNWNDPIKAYWCSFGGVNR